MTRSLMLAATALASIVVISGAAGAQPISGLYIGAAGGANFLQQERAQSITYPGSPSVAASGSAYHDTGVVGLASIGYGIGNGLRLELEGNFRYNRISKSSTPGIVSDGGREQKYGGMFNLLFDLDVGSPYIFPYIGGGAGYSWVDRRRNQTGAMSFTTPSGTYSGTSANILSSGTEGAFAYQAMAGLSFPVPGVVGLSMTAEYRFFALAGDRSYTQLITGTTPGPFARSVKITDNYNHNLMLGVRYAFNVAPPPVAAPAAPAPRVEAARTYLVFFDWDRADLTDRARQIIAEAAQATTRVQVTRIEVSGHTDTSGTPKYNQGLSVRRAQAVAAELVRLGVPQASITAQGFGQTKPLVATGPGVREPQNRRVEIVLR